MALSDADRVSVQEYLAQKYGLPGAFDPSSIAGLQLWLKGDSGIGDSSFYSFDERGNTRALVSPTGTLSDSYLYDTYGQQLTTSGSTANTFRYGGAFGYVFDGLDRMDVRMRGYDPGAGRWLSPDPIGFAGGDLNLYRCVSNRPVNYADPSGTWIPIVVAGVIIGFYFFIDAKQNPANTPMNSNAPIYFWGDVPVASNPNGAEASTLSIPFAASVYGPSWCNKTPVERLSIQEHEAYHRRWALVDFLLQPAIPIFPPAREEPAYRHERRWNEEQIKKLPKGHPNIPIHQKNIADIDDFLRNPDKM